ncbi:EAL domain-containing protein [Aestuariicella hydrocarbonica]|uniref:EAL domain-containing protein n=1 Tax=Pseudomaricurvus hydrocarbonicus TaxID=1470433 RepID=A0A9E5JRC3_9GAMM|nr:bifunctional diguanylate cyclase/phosphodiesterase [Aestuariicella hydrocarbonica]NHO65337.1 EAL domain-containing protein [Aestuariicella hydrocarbonica]
MLNYPQRVLLNDSQQNLEDAIAKLTGFTNVFILCRHADGHPELLSINGSPRFDQHGVCLGYQGICTVVEQQSAIQLVLKHFHHKLTGQLGEDYFRALVKALATTLHLDWVWVARFDHGKRKAVQTLSVWGDGEYRQNIIYPLQQTVCEKVVNERLKGAYIPLPNGLDEAISGTDSDFESYYGYLLEDNEGNPIGVLNCLLRKDVAQKYYLSQMIEIVAKRCESELLRLESNRSLLIQKGALEKAQLMTGFAAWRYEPDQDRLFFNDIAHSMELELPYSVNNLDDVMALVLPDYRIALKSFWEKLLLGAQLQELTFPIQTADGSVHWMQTIASGEVASSEVNFGKASSVAVERITGVIKDVSVSRLSDKRLRLLTEAVTQSSNAISITNLDGLMIYVNPAFVQLTGYDSEEILGVKERTIANELGPASNQNIVRDCLAAGRPWKGEFHNRRKDGSQYWASVLITPMKGDDGLVANYLYVQEDISYRKHQEEKLFHQAHHDALTGLPNRFLAMDRLSHRINNSKRSNQHTVLMLIDLDNFKQVNDSIGHAAGDILLMKIAKRLQSTLRSGDTVARLGGDEFVVILEFTSAQAAELSAKRIMHVLRAPMSIMGRELVTSASIGIAEYPRDGDTPEILMRNADAAMYTAKFAGKNTYSFFTPAMYDQSQKRLKIVSELRRALTRQEITLVYQPIVNAFSKEVIGAEALVRWNNEVLGSVSPLDFIPLAEELGLIVEMSDFIIAQAVAQCAQWSMYRADFLMAINVSPRQLRDNRLKRSLISAIESNNIHCHQIMLEVTEGVLVDNVDAALSFLQELTEQGFQLAIDDFGTGYSSLSYLKTFPFHRLKIDRSFIHDALLSHEDETLVRIMADLGHQFGMTVVAEGIENRGQEQLVEKLGIEAYQGNYFSPPLSPGDFQSLIEKSKDNGVILI